MSNLLPSITDLMRNISQGPDVRSLPLSPSISSLENDTFYSDNLTKLKRLMESLKDGVAFYDISLSRDDECELLQRVLKKREDQPPSLWDFSENHNLDKQEILLERLLKDTENIFILDSPLLPSEDKGLFEIIDEEYINLLLYFSDSENQAISCYAMAYLLNLFVYIPKYREEYLNEEFLEAYINKISIKYQLSALQHLFKCSTEYISFCIEHELQEKLLSLYTENPTKEQFMNHAILDIFSLMGNISSNDESIELNDEIISQLYVKSIQTIPHESCLQCIMEFYNANSSVIIPIILSNNDFPSFFEYYGAQIDYSLKSFCSLLITAINEDTISYFRDIKLFDSLGLCLKPFEECETELPPLNLIEVLNEFCLYEPNYLSIAIMDPFLSFMVNVFDNSYEYRIAIFHLFYLLFQHLDMSFVKSFLSQNLLPLNEILNEILVAGFSKDSLPALQILSQLLQMKNAGNCPSESLLEIFDSEDLISSLELILDTNSDDYDKEIVDQAIEIAEQVLSSIK